MWCVHADGKEKTRDTAHKGETGALVRARVCLDLCVPPHLDGALLGDGKVVGNVGLDKVEVVQGGGVLGVLDLVHQVRVAAQEHKCHVVLARVLQAWGVETNERKERAREEQA